jgi:RNA polymerase sigma-70 factor, ECF subfamily
MQKGIPDREVLFTELYRQSFDYVYAFILARTAGNRPMAEELVQETFAAAWLSLDRFRRESSLRTWLCSIANNKLRESYRNAIRKEKFELSEPPEELPDSLDLEQTVLNRETQQRVTRALERMSLLYRYALIMKYLDGRSVKEIAKALGRTNKATDGILQRARGCFQKNYAALEGGDIKHEG